MQCDELSNCLHCCEPDPHQSEHDPPEVQQSLGQRYHDNEIVLHVLTVDTGTSEEQPHDLPPGLHQLSPTCPRSSSFESGRIFVLSWTPSV